MKSTDFFISKDWFGFSSYFQKTFRYFRQCNYHPTHLKPEYWFCVQCKGVNDDFLHNASSVSPICERNCSSGKLENFLKEERRKFPTKNSTYSLITVFGITAGVDSREYKRRKTFISRRRTFALFLIFFWSRWAMITMTSTNQRLRLFV